MLIHFFNDIINQKGIREGKDLTFGPSVPDAARISQNKGILQVLCQDRNSLECLVAMYVARTAKFYEQGRYDAAAIKKEANPQQSKGMASLAITSFNIFSGNFLVRSKYVYTNTETFKDTLKDFSFTVIDLSKITKKKAKKPTDIKEKWYEALMHAPEPEIPPEVDAKLVKDLPILKRSYQELQASA